MGAPYSFTRSATEDLIDIWLYSRETWGEAQADRYQDSLHDCFERIAAGTVHAKSVSSIDLVRSHHCHHHYIFFVEQRGTITVVAVLHERMDLIERLRDRL